MAPPTQPICLGERVQLGPAFLLIISKAGMSLAWLLKLLLTLGKGSQAPSPLSYITVNCLFFSHALSTLPVFIKALHEMVLATF